MREIYKVELRRAFTGKRFFIALFIGMAISVCHMILCMPSQLEEVKYQFEYYSGLSYPITAFSKWIGGNPITWQQRLYFIVFPLIASIPYGTSLFEDRKNGFMKNVLTKCRKQDYFRAKFLAIFLSGGCVVVLPLIINFIVYTMAFPILLPEVTTDAFSVTSHTMFAGIFYSYPLIYLGIYFVIEFIFAGIYANISMLISNYTEYKFVVEGSGLLVYIFIFSLFDLLGIWGWSPIHFLNPSYPRISTIGVFTQMILGLLVILGFVIYNGRRNETY